MKKPDKPKTDNIGWILAMLFPKKGKSTPQPASTPSASSTPAATPAAPPPAAKPPAATPSPAAEKKPIAAAKTSKPGKEPGRFLPAFWTTASVLSVIVNLILIVVIVILAQQLFSLKRLVGNSLIGGLYENFILMDQAHIKTNITVADNIAIKFDLPISQEITVILTQDTVIYNARVGVLSGPTTVTLPKGTNLPIQLNLTVPVSTTIPIKLNVPVDSALEKTDLHKPFVGLQGVVSPYYWMLQPQIKSASDLPACQGILGGLCRGFFK